MPRQTWGQACPGRIDPPTRSPATPGVERALGSAMVSSHRSTRRQSWRAICRCGVCRVPSPWRQGRRPKTHRWRSQRDRNRVTGLLLGTRNPAVDVERWAEPGRIVVRLRCEVCKRACLPSCPARRRHGRNPLDDLLARLSADYAWQDEAHGNGCRVRFADLPPRRTPKLPASLPVRAIPAARHR